MRLLHKPKIVSPHEIQNSSVHSDAIVRCIGLRCNPNGLAEGPLPLESMKALSSKAGYRFRLGHRLVAQRSRCAAPLPTLMKRAFVTGVGTSDLLGTEASEDCNTASSAETPNLPRVWLNEAATLGQHDQPRAAAYRSMAGP